MWNKCRRIISAYLLPCVFFGFSVFFLVAHLLRLPATGSLSGVTLSSYPETGNIVRDICNGDFQDAFDSWLTDNLFGHTTFVKIHNQIQYSVFRDGSGDWILGDDGYIYSKSQTYSYTGGSKYQPQTAQEYDEYASSIAAIQEKLEAEGKDFLLIINPIKAEVYPEHLPWNEKLLVLAYSRNGDSGRDLLLAALDKYGVHYYDTTQDFLAMKEYADFDLYANTGHHMTWTAMATEMNTILSAISSVTGDTYPEIEITDIVDKLYGTDQDALTRQNVYFPIYANEYLSPEITYSAACDTNVLLWGTSYGLQIVASLYQDENNKVFSRLCYYEYFTNRRIYSSEGVTTDTYTSDTEPYEEEILNEIRVSDLVLLEQQDYSITHQKFVTYVNENIGGMNYHLGENIIACSSSVDYVAAEYDNFSASEDWGRWSVGSESSVTLYGELSEQISDGTLELALNFRAGSYYMDQTVDVYLNDIFLGSIEVAKASGGWSENGEYSIIFPVEYLLEETNVIRFELSEEVVAPSEVSDSGDTRLLGLGFTSMAIEEVK